MHTHTHSHVQRVFGSVNEEVVDQGWHGRLF